MKNLIKESRDYVILILQIIHFPLRKAFGDLRSIIQDNY